MQLNERVLRFIPETTEISWIDIYGEFDQRDMDELSETVSNLVSLGFIERIETASGSVVYRRTIAGSEVIRLNNDIKKSCGCEPDESR